MPESSVFWLRAAIALYAVGLFHTIRVSLKKGNLTFRTALGAFVVGAVLQGVSLVEAARLAGRFPAPGFHQSVSLCAFLIAVLFLLVYSRYRYESVAVFVFPLVFCMTVLATIRVPSEPVDTARNTLVGVHVIGVLVGYAALMLTAISSVLYLVQERNLKRKKPIALLERLPPLDTIDGLISRSMWVGFALITIGVLTGASWSFEAYGPRWVDPRITTAMLTWLFCLVMVLLRITAGWRGRKAALLAIAVVACSAATWAMHYTSR